MNGLQIALTQARALLMPRPIRFLDNTVRYKAALRQLVTEVTSVPNDAHTRGVDDFAALGDVLEERRRQMYVLGWTGRHDDVVNVRGELVGAAVCYAKGSARGWPWDLEWWKPSKDKRRNLVKAAALILAEIERLDRLEKGN